MSEGVGSAKEELNERYSNKVQRIIDSEGHFRVKIGFEVEQAIIIINGLVYIFPAVDGYVSRWLCYMCSQRTRP